MYSIERFRHPTSWGPGTCSRGPGGRAIPAVALSIAFLVAVLVTLSGCVGQAPDQPGQGSGTASGQSSASGTPSAAESALSIYYLLGWGTDLRLARETHVVTSGPGPDQRTAAAVQEMISAPPMDPDYARGWDPATRVLGVEVPPDGAIEVDLSAEARALSWTDQAGTAVAQQLIHTATAATGTAQPVQLLVEGEPAGLMWDVVDWSVPIARADPLDILLLAQIDAPQEGAQVPRTFRVTGRARSFEANLLWSLETADGRPVTSGFTMTVGDGPVPPFDFTVTLPDTWAAGSYRIIVEQDDPSGGEAEPGPMRDDKVVQVG
jgi:hypothetical protein